MQHSRRRCHPSPPHCSSSSSSLPHTPICSKFTSTSSSLLQCPPLRYLATITWAPPPPPGTSQTTAAVNSPADDVDLHCDSVINFLKLLIDFRRESIPITRGTMCRRRRAGINIHVAAPCGGSYVTAVAADAAAMVRSLCVAGAAGAAGVPLRCSLLRQQEALTCGSA